MAVQARMLSQALKVINNDLVGKKTVVIFINQIRASLVAYGNPETTSGGKALLFYSSIRLSVSIKSQSFVEGEINGEKRKVGHTIKFRVVKSKVGPGYGEAELDVNYFTGVDRVRELFLMGIKRQVIEQSGPMYRFKTISWKGQDAAFAAIKDDKKLQEELLIEIHKHVEEKTN
jgi:recombination protein RecA